MSSTTRLAAVLLALALPGTLVAGWLTAAGDPRTFSLDTIPTELMGYERAAEERFDPEIVAQIRPDEYLMRLYAPEQGAPVWLYLGLYSGVGAQRAHGPAACYPAQGWDVTGSRNVEVLLANGEKLIARALVAVRGRHRELVLYWFQSAGRWPGREVQEQLLRVYDSLRGTPQYAFVRLSVEFSGAIPPEETLLELAGQLAPHIRSVVDTPTG